MKSRRIFWISFQSGEVVPGGVVEAGIRLVENNLGQGFFGDDVLETVEVSTAASFRSRPPRAKRDLRVFGSLPWGFP